MSDDVGAATNAGARASWRPVQTGGAEYLFTVGIVGGCITWDRPSRTWIGHLIGYPDSIPRTCANKRLSGFRTAVEAQQWVERSWGRVTSKASSN